MDGLTGLTGLQIVTEDSPEATAEEIHGNAADPYHAHRGEQAQPYSWESMQTPGGSHGPYQPEEGLIDEGGQYFILNSGLLEDDPTSERAPWTHAAPWPSDPIGDGSDDPDNIRRQVIQNAQIHATKVGGLRNIHAYTLEAQQDQWTELWNVTPGHTDLTNIPEQMKSGAAAGGRGGTDRTQSNAKQNQYGYDSAHQHRRYATGHIPGNQLWLIARGRPMIKSLAGPARPPIGIDSPFAGNDVGQAFSVDGALLQDTPTEYMTPPQPAIASPQVVSDAPVDYLDWYGG